MFYSALAVKQAEELMAASFATERVCLSPPLHIVFLWMNFCLLREGTGVSEYVCAREREKER